MHATNIRVRTDGDLVEGPRHHGDEHIEQYDHGSPVVDSEHYVSETLGESTLITLAKLHRPRILQPEYRPVDRAKRVLQTATHTANGNNGNADGPARRAASCDDAHRAVLLLLLLFFNPR